MKKIYSLIAALSLALCTQATIHTIQVADFSFSPSNVSAVCGDTVAWVWVSGTHTTTSTSVPACATSWSAPINSSIAGYAIVIPCAGTYNYVCAFHAIMTGTITATCTTGMEEANASSSLFFPNPFAEKITITDPIGDRVVIYDMLGNILKQVSLSGNSTVQLDLADLPRGIYFLGMSREGRIVETRKISKQ